MNNKIFYKKSAARIYSTLLYLILLPNLILSQNIKFTGRVIDSVNENPLSFATLSIDSTGIGTITNDKGYFNFKIPRKLINKIITINYLGYKSEKIRIITNYSDSIIKLTPASFILSEIEITALTAEEIVRKAVDSTRKRYISFPVIFDEFLRIKETSDPITIQLYEISARSYQKQGYNFSPIINIIKGRYFADTTKCLWSYSNDYLYGINEDPIASKEFFNKKKMKLYKYEITGNTNYNDHMIYIINFNKIKNKNYTYSGRIFIDSETYKILQIDILNKPLTDKTLQVNNCKLQKFPTVNYSYYFGNYFNYCYLQSWSENSYVKIYCNDSNQMTHIKIDISAAINNIEINVTPLQSEKTTIKRKSLNSLKIEKIDSHYWDDINIIEP
ncbi:MAG: carboxypeptidase-like regulatory domain-containing protein [Bacteroidia bacterium]|nr:carboxypeptidase-like regulatory domain-containing protein [Bacteroidia bacterium]